MSPRLYNNHHRVRLADERSKSPYRMSDRKKTPVNSQNNSVYYYSDTLIKKAQLDQDEGKKVNTKVSLEDKNALNSANGSTLV